MDDVNTILGADSNTTGAGAGDGGTGDQNANGGGQQQAAKTPEQIAAETAAANQAALEAAKVTRDAEITAKLTTEGKTAEEIAAAIADADKAAIDAAKAPKGAPEKYEPFKMPEGLTLDTATSDKFVVLAKELNLSQEQAQKLVDMQSDFVVRQGKAQLESFSQTVKAWKDQTIKALGVDADKKLAVAAKTKVAFGSPELATLLNESGLGNHPEMVKFFIRIGEKITEDKIVTGPNSGGEKSFAARLYPEKK